VAAIPKVKCPACGNFQNLDNLGIGDDGSYEPVEHPMVFSVQRIGGRGRCTWEHRKLPVALALVVRQSLASALERVDALIAGGD